VAFKGRTSRSRRLGFTSRPTIAGRLVTEGGTGIGGATVVVQARRRQFRATTSPIDTLTTAADGTFSYKLVSGPARTITFAYTAFAGDAGPAVTSATLRTIVPASLTASATPRSPRAGQLLRIGGALSHLPRANVQVTIQARQGRSWKTVGTVKTRAGGRYSWPQRFTRAQRGRTFKLRAHVDSPVYPLTPGNSRPVSVRVR
jgi:5-hydroxyisourate hydrolase-like protein (transthyretin family)